MTNAPDLSTQLAASAGTDLGVLLKAKEDAKRLVMDTPTPANLAALKSATQMLEAAQNVRANLKDTSAVLAYVEEAGRKLKKTKLYDDIGLGRLKKQPDGTFKLRDVDRYAATLPTLGTSDKVAADAAQRQKKREEAEIRRIENAAAKEEFQLNILKGRYVTREAVYLELAGRAVTLASGLKTAFESSVLDLISLVEGSPKKAQNLIQALEEKLDAALNEYAQVEEFEVLFSESPPHAEPEEREEES